MNKIIALSIFLVFPLILLASDKHHISTNYAFNRNNFIYTSQEHQNNIDPILHSPILTGTNLKYRYENIYSPFSIMTSVSYLEGQDTTISKFAEKNISSNIFTTMKSNQTFLMLGNAYRINKFISIYGLTGINFSNIALLQKSETLIDQDQNEFTINQGKKEKNKDFAYSLGIQINLTKKLFLDINYERSIYRKHSLIRNMPQLNSGNFVFGVGVTI